MDKKTSFFYSLILSLCFFTSLPLQAWNCCLPLDIIAEGRVAYYHPSSKKVRHIYGDGWADYQLEISKGVGYNFRVWAGVSGFSRKGESIGFHDSTKLQLIPISFGLKYDIPILCNLKLFIGGAACYSFLRIHDHSEYVREHTRKEDWGGLVQSGLIYKFCKWGVVSVFADYYFQRFHFHNIHYGSFYGSNYYYGSRFIERSTLDMNGYKVGVGLGVAF